MIRQLLHGKSVFLSASVPNPEGAEKYQRVRYAEVQIMEAVVSLSRAVIGAGGTLVFGGHPTISPLVAMIAWEYRLPGDAELSNTLVGDGVPYSQVVIYQSEAYREVVPHDTWQLFNSGAARLNWTPAIGGECFDPRQAGQPQCAESLKRMRLAMLEEQRPVAMVCIGGMEGVEEEAQLFRSVSPSRPRYAFSCTGGAASLLCQSNKDFVREFDQEVLRRLNWKSSRESDDDIQVFPFPLICQLLVQEISAP